MGVRGPGWEHTDEMICVRKPGHMFGWDIAPRFVSAGCGGAFPSAQSGTHILKKCT